MLPTITGTATVGATLTAGAGTWSGSGPTFTYQWLTCDSAGANCVDLGRAVASTHVITTSDTGSHAPRRRHGDEQLRLEHCDVGGRRASPDPRSNVTPPSISGTTQTGSTLTAATGLVAWDSRLRRSRPVGAVQRGRESAARTSRSHASTYVPVAADLGLTLRVKVGATNTERRRDSGRVGCDGRHHARRPVPAAARRAGRRLAGGGSNDLVTTVTVDRTTAPVGGSFVWRINVTNVGGGIAFGVNVDVALSANMVYGFSQVNRGSGCKPAATAGHYTCNLDLLGRAGTARPRV